MQMFNKDDPASVYTYLVYIVIPLIPAFLAVVIYFLSEANSSLLYLLYPTILFPFFVMLDKFAQKIHNPVRYFGSINIFNRWILVSIILISGLITDFFYIFAPVAAVNVRSGSLIEVLLQMPILLFLSMFSFFFAVLLVTVFFLLIIRKKLRKREIVMNPTFRD